jgi:hypothetical protein
VAAKEPPADPKTLLAQPAKEPAAAINIDNEAISTEASPIVSSISDL